MTPLLWLAVPLAPLLGLLLVWRWPRLAPGLGLLVLPALLAALAPPATLALPLAWPGAAWGTEDAPGRALLAGAAVLWGCATVFAAAHLNTHRWRFWASWLLALSGNVLLIIAADAASFYVGFTLMSLAAYGLVVHLGGPGPRQAGRVYLQLAVLGEMLLYAAVLLRVHEAGGQLNLAAIKQAPVSALSAALLLLGFGLKAGFWPLHVWLPLAHPAAPAAASAVLSGAMLNAGILGLWRFLPTADPLLQQWAPVVFGVGLVSAFFGVLLGVIQRHAKVALAYSSVSQMGYLLAILATAWAVPAQTVLWGGLLALFAVHHGFAKGALFMGAGMAANQRLHGLHWLALGLAALALAGLPLSSGAAAKTVLKTQLAATPFAAALGLLSVGSIATALLLARVMWLLHAKQAARARPQAAQTVVVVALGFAALYLPWLWPDMRTALLQSLAPGKLMALAWPLVVAAVIAVGCARWGKVPRWRLPNPARRLSLWLKLRLQRPTLTRPGAPWHAAVWRARERRWNRWWRSDTVAVTTALLMLLLLGGLALVGF